MQLRDFMQNGEPLIHWCRRKSVKPSAGQRARRGRQSSSAEPDVREVALMWVRGLTQAAFER